MKVVLIAPDQIRMRVHGSLKGCVWEAGRDVSYPGFKNCLYGGRDGTFLILALKTVYMGGGTGRFLSQL